MTALSRVSLVISAVLLLSSVWSGLSAPIDAAACTSGLGPLAVAKQRVFTEWYNNTAFAPADNGTTHAYSTSSAWAYHTSLSWSLPADIPSSLLPNSGTPLSFQAHGHVIVPATTSYYFRCAYRNNLTMDAKLWVDDHLVCPEDLNNLQMVMPFTAGQLLNIRLEASQNASWAAEDPTVPVLSLT